jgi:hypothetical protein
MPTFSNNATSDCTTFYQMKYQNQPPKLHPLLTHNGVQINISPRAWVDVQEPIEAPSDGILHRFHR